MDILLDELTHIKIITGMRSCLLCLRQLFYQYNTNHSHDYEAILRILNGNEKLVDFPGENLHVSWLRSRNILDLSLQLKEVNRGLNSTGTFCK